MLIDSNIVGPRYFTTMKIPIVQGRDFDERDRDSAPCAAIVNEVFARRYFAATGPALGRRLAKYEDLPQPVTQWCEIVGVVRDDRWQSLQKTMQPYYALTVHQSDPRRMWMFVHTAGEPASHIAAVRRIVRELDPALPVNDIQTLADQFAAHVYPFRLLATIMGACGAMALLLAAVGIYGIVSYSVAQRTREVGIRMALGALRHDILKMVIGQGLLLTAVGLVSGLLLSAALTRVLTSSLFETEVLFGVDATDAATFGAVTILLALVAAVACYIPARRATRVDPLVALRYE
jgi:putative ABC transport system permease protein